jgi:hypothetical protein
MMKKLSLVIVSLLFCTFSSVLAHADALCTDIVNNLLTTAQLPKIGETNSPYRQNVNTAEMSKAQQDPPQLEVTSLDHNKKKEWNITIGQFFSAPDSPTSSPGMAIVIDRDGATVGSRFPSHDGRSYDHESVQIMLQVTGVDEKGRKLCRISKNFAVQQTLSDSKDKGMNKEISLNQAACKAVLDANKQNQAVYKEDTHESILTKGWDRWRKTGHEEEVGESLWICKFVGNSFAKSDADTRADNDPRTFSPPKAR